MLAIQGWVAPEAVRAALCDCMGTYNGGSGRGAAFDRGGRTFGGVTST